MFDLYVITDERPDAELVARARDALQATAPGRVALQLRAKARPPATLIELSERLRAIAADAGAPFFVNTHLELAACVQADGVQLPEHGPAPATARARLGRDVHLGRSCHDLAGVRRAAAEGADFVTLGPFACSPGKPPPLTREQFERISRLSRVPVLALGGVDADRAPDALGAGAHGVAVVRAVFDARDPARALAELLHALDRTRMSAS